MTDISKTDQEFLISVAHKAADAARKVTLSYFRGQQLATENKAGVGFDPVTKADREAEAAICDILQELRPQDAIQGEEHGNQPGTSGLTWVLDPIDGTRGYMSGTPTWGTLISIRDETGPIMGLIDQPHIGERFFGGFGVSELNHNGNVTPLGVHPAASLGDAILYTTHPGVGSKVEEVAFHALAKNVRLLRYGMDCYAYALLAAGTIDLVVEAGLFPYDIQAPIAVIQAAGGVITDWDGHPAHEGGRVLAAASAELHASAMKVLQASLKD